MYITSDTSPRAYAHTGASGTFRQSAQDFIVNERLPFEPDGAGEHLLVQVRKTDQNTDWIAKWMARCAGVERREVGYCGLKDRHAVATQWFSVPATRGEPDLSEPPEGTELLQSVRHGRKLRPGSHAANHFVLVLRDIEAPSLLQAQLEQVAAGGCPNGFGLQRFGREGGNLLAALEWFGGGKKPKRHQKSHYLSAARSAIFNADDYEQTIAKMREKMIR
ncbi:MAG: tRNA pseudouridine(13) synthase TruD [Granulosicoccaceae bacterium]